MSLSLIERGLYVATMVFGQKDAAPNIQDYVNEAWLKALNQPQSHVVAPISQDALPPLPIPQCTIFPTPEASKTPISPPSETPIPEPSVTPAPTSTLIPTFIPTTELPPTEIPTEEEPTETPTKEEPTKTVLPTMTKTQKIIKTPTPTPPPPPTVPVESSTPPSTPPPPTGSAVPSITPTEVEATHTATSTSTLPPTPHRRRITQVVGRDSGASDSGENIRWEYAALGTAVLSVFWALSGKAKEVKEKVSKAIKRTK